ncbi:MAG: OadG family protein [Chloroflexaceae bacterium]|nr:OadG family protein [Chloroflexaceae bacterium]
MDDAMTIGLRLTVTGMVVVFFGLIVLLLVMHGFQYFDRWLEARAARQQKRRQRKQGAAQPRGSGVSDGSIPPEVMAAIAAAVAIAIDRKVRIRRIRYRALSEGSWSRQGRVTIMASHVTRR